MSGATFNCVAIETATEKGSIAVSCGSERYACTLDNDRTNSRQIFGRITELLDKAELPAALN